MRQPRFAVFALTFLFMASLGACEKSAVETAPSPGPITSVTTTWYVSPTDVQAKGEPQPTPPKKVAVAAPIHVTFRLEAMHAVKTTEDEDCDEVYVLAWTQGSSKRLPGGDDYYAAYRNEHLQVRNWRDKDDEPHGAPTLWSGTLADGESRTWYVLIGEQDGDRVFPVVTNALYPVLSAEPIDPRDPVVNEIRKKQHQVIGGIRLVAHNAAGRLVVDSWNGRPNTKDEGHNPERGPNAEYFVALGDVGCQYNFVANIYVGN